MILGICDNISVLKVLRIVKIVITVFKISVPILLLVTGAISYMKTMKSNDIDIAGANKIFIKKCIAAIIIFLIPTFVHIIVDLTMPDTEVYDCLNNATIEAINNKRIEKIDALVERARTEGNLSDYSSAIREVNNLDDEALKNKYSTILSDVKKEIDKKVAEKRKQNRGTNLVGDIICNSPYANLNGRSTENYYQVFEYNSPYPDNYVRESFDKSGSVWGAYSFTATTKNNYISFLENNYPGLFDELINAAKRTNYGDSSPMISYIKSAYNAHPDEFIESQDRFMYESYGYKDTIKQIKDLGIDLDNRPSIITGMFLSMADAAGAYSVADKMAGHINDSMDDYELVDAACDAFVNSAFGQTYSWVSDRWSRNATANTALMIPERQLIKDILSGKYNCE